MLKNFFSCPESVEILSVNGFIEWSANVFGSFGAYFVLFSFVFLFVFYCWLAFVVGENLCVAEELQYDWLESLEGVCCRPWRYPPKSTVVCWKRGLRIKLRFLLFNSNGTELEELSPLEGFSVSFRCLESQKEKKWEFESTRRILYYIQNSRREFKVSTS